VIIPREAAEKLKDLNNPDAMIGTGRFVMKSYQRGVRGVYERNPDFYLSGLPNLDAVHLEVIPEQNTRLPMLGPATPATLRSIASETARRTRTSLKGG
jgi:peptide/nickel transport system substrate-binding protein